MKWRMSVNILDDFLITTVIMEVKKFRTLETIMIKNIRLDWGVTVLGVHFIRCRLTARDDQITHFVNGDFNV